MLEVAPTTASSSAKPAKHSADTKPHTLKDLTHRLHLRIEELAWMKLDFWKALLSERDQQFRTRERKNGAAGHECDLV
jgi:hypothetical protein